MMSKFFIWLYGFHRASINNFIIRIINKLEGREFYSPTLRKIFLKYYDVEIGMYTHGGCFVPHQFERKTTIGRYCSIAKTAFAATINHPMEKKSMHGFFFDPKLGYCTEEMKYSPLQIGNDVWLGHNCIIMPNVNIIGDGAVIGAGAVVNKDVPPYAVLVGNPAKIVRYRFSKESIEKLLTEKWWDKSIDEINENIDEYTKRYEESVKQNGNTLLS